MKHAIRLLIYFFLYPSLGAIAQSNPGKLMGTVTDTARQAVALANVKLYAGNNHLQPVRTTVTDKNGRFVITADTGKYLLSITHISLAETSVRVTVSYGDNVLDTIVLSSATNLLQDVTVTVRKPLIEQTNDKLIYNVENDPAAKSETATDLLRKTPMVTVDGDGNVQLNGQGNFKILLNGRETAMFAQNVKDALRNFPGAVISKIEVITSPSAKYDAEGVGGIINIITKKKVIGYNGFVSSYYSTFGNYSEDAGLNLKSGKTGLSFFAGTSGLFHPMSSFSSVETVPVNSTVFSKRTLDGEVQNKNRNYYANLELTCDLDSFQTVAVYGNIGRSRSMSWLDQLVQTDRPLQPSENGSFMNDNISDNPNQGAGMDFIRRFRGAPDKEFSVRVNGQFSRTNLFNNSLLDNPVQDRFVSNESVSKNREYTLQADFVQPLIKRQKLETGIKAILRNASSDFNSLVKYAASESYKPNPSNSDRFGYHQEVYSIYASYSTSWKKYSFRSGLRMEQTSVSGDFASTKTRVRQSYINLVPNILFTVRFTPVYTLNASYNMRLQRPYINSLNPFVNNNDSLTISFGNPNLGPQALHALSLQNRFVKGKFFASISLNGSYTDNQIVQFISFDPATGVTSTTSANVGREYQLSLGASSSIKASDKLSVGLNTVLRYNNVENRSNRLQRNNGISGLAAGFFSYKVAGGFSVSGSGGISRTVYSLTGSPSVNAFYQVNFGYRFFNDKLSVTMNVNNFHAAYFRFSNVVENPGYRIISRNDNPFRVIYFGATYNFGKLKETVSKKKGVSNDDLVP